MINPYNFAVSGPVGGWVELGRTTLGSAGGNITVSSLPNKRYYMLLGNVLTTGGDVNTLIRTGNGSIDSGTNYNWRYSLNGGADGTHGSGATYMFNNQQLETNPEFIVYHVANYTTKEKLGIGHCVKQKTAGAGTAPNRLEHYGKWANTSNSIDTFNFSTSESGSFNTGSEVVVLGYDPSDTHTTNFWEELATADLSGGIVDTGVFTAKKYLWVQGFAKSGDPVTSGFMTMYVGNGTVDKTTVYAERSSVDGLGDGTSVNQSTNGLFRLMGQGGGNPNESVFFNTFIVNNTSNEKLFIGHANWGQSGAGVAPDRTEGVAKYVNTTSQINRITIEHPGSGSLATGTIRVWGSN